MKKSLLSFLGSSTLAISAIVGISSLSPALAVPNLQLNVTNGTYLGGTEESGTNIDSLNQVINSFTLNAYCQNKTTGGNKNLCFSDTYFISISLQPKTQTVPSTIGSFDFGGITYTAADFIQGMPSGLPTHGVFPSAYKEVNIGSFLSTQTTASVDVETTPGWNPAVNPGVNLAYQSFLVDITNLDSAYQLHFDLYNKEDGQANLNAPFSHDVLSTPGESNPIQTVPEPSSIMGILGVAGIGALFARRKY